MKKLVFCLVCFLFLANNEIQASNIYQGNVRTMTYHQPDCRHYGCKSCTKYFDSWEEAEKEGFKHCKLCIVPYPPPPTPVYIPPPPPPPPPENLEEVILRLLTKFLGLIVAQLIVFALYNCFLEKDMDFLERWKRFQGWLFAKSTKTQLKNKITRSTSEAEKLLQASKVKRFFLYLWYGTRDLLFRLNQFAGCFVNFVLLFFFLR
ncbi:exported hypothetical protein [Desulfamplus magnetovallimortis]|uniref:Ada DNA repair metal-binding domain-containing protein n=1 Tax=Desulfamplus magnetovallimortis TaxID=1246637 RepID=A0A1W1H642_9BACT|nr:Ada metal-binding domain-containing protein [Desulfamplus magnetovallimortis]SLM27838.1 exported hypothetical protein [Desulfamplus magnetovallimortis]